MDFNKKNAVTRAEALPLLLSHCVFCPEIEKVPPIDAVGRVTAERIVSRLTLPVCRVSAMDGYAVRSSDFANGMPDTRDWVSGKEYAPADTGDDFPDAYDAVIQVEDTEFDEKGRIHFTLSPEEVKAGFHVRKAGSYIMEGDLIAPEKKVITPEIASVMAMGGITEVPVVKKPRVAFLPTGSELIPAGTIPKRGENIDSNSILVSGLLKQIGAEPVCYPITKDDRELLSKRLDEAVATCDIVVINGGSSKGGEDFNAHLIQERGSFFQHGVKAVPGKPIGFAVIDGKPVLNMPGPAAACAASADWLLKKVVYAYLGIPAPVRPKVKGILTEELHKSKNSEVLSRMMVTRGENGYLISAVPHGTRLPRTLCEANAFLPVPIGAEGFLEGDEVEVELLTGEENLV